MSEADRFRAASAQGQFSTRNKSGLPQFGLPKRRAALFTKRGGGKAARTARAPAASELEAPKMPAPKTRKRWPCARANTASFDRHFSSISRQTTSCGYLSRCKNTHPLPLLFATPARPRRGQRRRSRAALYIYVVLSLAPGPEQSACGSRPVLL